MQIRSIRHCSDDVPFLARKLAALRRDSMRDAGTHEKVLGEEAGIAAVLDGQVLEHSLHGAGGCSPAAESGLTGPGGQADATGRSGAEPTGCTTIHASLGWGRNHPTAPHPSTLNTARLNSPCL